MELTCRPRSGDLPFNFSWTGPTGTELSNNATISVIFSTSGDTSSYTCIASNPFGNSSTTIEVIRAGKKYSNHQKLQYDDNSFGHTLNSELVKIESRVSSFNVTISSFYPQCPLFSGT